MNQVLSKNDYKIIIEIYNSGGDTELKSFTLKHISNLTKLSIVKIRTAIKKFIELNYINEGARQHREKTYYITELGKQKIQEII